MARYDEWRRGGRHRPSGGDRYGYDRGFYSPSQRRPSGHWGPGLGPSPRRGYDQDWNPGWLPGRGRGPQPEQAQRVYGPSRYGLGPYHERLSRRARSDDELREEVEEALFHDTWVDADAINVSVNDGIVTLSGELPNYEEIRYATDDAWDVDGVRGVRSELDVRSS